MQHAKKLTLVLALLTAVLAASVTPAAQGAPMKVAICATDVVNVPAWDVDVQSKLLATGLFSAVDLFDCNAGTPSLATFQGYAAVLAYSDGGFADPAQLAQNLADYVDGGGRLVVATFAYDDVWAYFQGTVLETGGYLPFTLGTQSQGDGPLTLVADVPSSPLLAGVTSFSGGTSYRALVTLTAGATQVAHWSDGTPLVGFKGNVVGLNFFPPSNDAEFGSEFWDASTDGVRLMTNALGAATPSAQSGNRAGFCSVAGNTTPNGTPYPAGTFLDLGPDQPSTDARYKGATAAFYYQGKGISCDALPGYTRTGEMVGYGGHGDPGGYAYMATN